VWVTLRRTLVLNEDDLVMVVKEDVVKQIDENRGELNRTEFVTHLIQTQLKEHTNRHDYVTRGEFREFTQEIQELLRNFLQFLVSCGMVLGGQPSQGDLEVLNQQLGSLEGSDEETEDM
jgi:hypothetical protein